MGAHGSEFVGFLSTVAGGILIGGDRWTEGAVFPWKTLAGVILVLAGYVLLMRARGLAVREAAIRE